MIGKLRTGCINFRQRGNGMASGPEEVMMLMKNATNDRTVPFMDACAVPCVWTYSSIRRDIWNAPGIAYKLHFFISPGLHNTILCVDSPRLGSAADANAQLPIGTISMICKMLPYMTEFCGRHSSCDPSGNRRLLDVPAFKNCVGVLMYSNSVPVSGKL